MFTRIKAGLTYANVMATIAVFLALGGGTYAALKLPKNSVGTKQIKNGAVTGAKVKAGSLLSKDFKAGQLPAGAQGLKGEKGDKGDPGASGRDGTSAATNVVVRTKTQTSALSANGEADCNPGERAVGGGASRSDGSMSGSDRLFSSFPVAVPNAGIQPAPAGSTPTAWNTGIALTSAAPITFYVICVSP